MDCTLSNAVVRLGVEDVIAIETELAVQQLLLYTGCDSKIMLARTTVRLQFYLQQLNCYKIVEFRSFRKVKVN